VTLRARLTLVAAGVVAVVVAAASFAVYFSMRHGLRTQVDTDLAVHARSIQDHPAGGFRGFADFTNDGWEIVDDTGAFVSGNVRLPVDKTVREVGSGKRDAFYRDVAYQGYHLREVVAPLPDPLGSVIVARSLHDVDAQLGRLRLILLLVSLGGVGAAALAGALVSRTTLAPVRRLTAAAERIARTGDPSERVPEGGRGELARLGASFNTMLGALEESLETQRRFVADASHELRTPLTSLQTNIDVLRREAPLEPDARRRLLADLHRESQEMRSLIGGLLELARGEEGRRDRDRCQLDEVVEAAVERARARFPEIVWRADLEPTVVDGYPDRLERAVWNLLENAGKWSGDGGSVEVSLRGGELRVRDHGPGIAPEDRPLVFDRFYRSAAARSMPGSGLGLAIVREVAEAHGGTVTADEAPGGGALIRLRLDGAAHPNETLTSS
jgi:two-component system, OmpR family, sensor histidine kinase MprB